ncbi:MAG: S8 family serine peptidase [Pseudomonadota bacterium]
MTFPAVLPPLRATSVDALWSSLRPAWAGEEAMERAEARGGPGEAAWLSDSLMLGTVSPVGAERAEVAPLPDIRLAGPLMPSDADRAASQPPAPVRAPGELIPADARRIETADASPSTPATAASYDGRGHVIIVIDDGSSPFYDQSRTLWSYDFAGANDRDAGIDTLDSHGSWVAQTALAEAGGAAIIHLKVFPDDGGGAPISDLEEALRFSERLSDVFKVAAVNLSLGFGNATEPTLTPLSDEFARLDDRGVISIVASGNARAQFPDGVNVIAADPNVVAVGAVDQSGNLAGFSQTSDTLVDVAATGVSVRVETTDGSFGFVNGTSFAAPEVAGIAARLSQASWDLLGEDLTDEELLDVLNATGTEVGGVDVPYLEAQGDAAVAYFLDNLALYDDPFVA